MHEPFDDECLLYHSGELPAERRGGFEEHLAGCLECRESLDALRSALKAAELASHSLPEARLESMAERVLGMDAKPAAPMLRKAWRVGMALAALAVGVHVTTLFRDGGHESAWSNGIEKDLVALDGRLEELDSDMQEAYGNIGIEEDLRRLEDASASIEQQIGRKP